MQLFDKQSENNEWIVHQSWIIQIRPVKALTTLMQSGLPINLTIFRLRRIIPLFGKCTTQSSSNATNRSQLHGGSQELGTWNFVMLQGDLKDSQELNLFFIIQIYSWNADCSQQECTGLSAGLQKVFQLMNIENADTKQQYNKEYDRTTVQPADSQCYYSLFLRLFQSTFVH